MATGILVGNKMKVMCSFDRATFDAINALAVVDDRSCASMIRALVREALAARKAKEQP